MSANETDSIIRPNLRGHHDVAKLCRDGFEEGMWLIEGSLALLEDTAKYVDDSLASGMLLLRYPNERYFDDIPTPPDIDEILQSIKPSTTAEQVNNSCADHALHVLLVPLNHCRPHINRFLKAKPDQFFASLQAIPINDKEMPTYLAYNRDKILGYHRAMEAREAIERKFEGELLRVLTIVDGIMRTHIQKIEMDQILCLDTERAEFSTYNPGKKRAHAAFLANSVIASKQPHPKDPSPMDQSVGGTTLTKMISLQMMKQNEKFITVGNAIGEARAKIAAVVGKKLYRSEIFNTRTSFLFRQSTMANDTGSIKRVFEKYMVAGKVKADADQYAGETVYCYVAHQSGSPKLYIQVGKKPGEEPSTVIAFNLIDPIDAIDKSKKVDAQKDQLKQIWFDQINPHTPNPISGTRVKAAVKPTDMNNQSIPGPSGDDATQGSNNPPTNVASNSLTPFEKFKQQIRLEHFEVPRVCIAIEREIGVRPNAALIQDVNERSCLLCRSPFNMYDWMVWAKGAFEVMDKKNSRVEAPNTTPTQPRTDPDTIPNEPVEAPEGIESLPGFETLGEPMPQSVNPNMQLTESDEDPSADILEFLGMDASCYSSQG
ncbi:hypothetical protein NA57DRAFT_56707 [Rhizodiscina lignyota]|uniref:Uncharacterized protein n=1 Tax=Rhizodiscina lignyota TaxID=1504668 RepID=A0A9P4IBZ9_9PEZI|nr:hypothetical protein NA57DRAFT_56707 [Rhizodiscina lignyota]